MDRSFLSGCRRYVIGPGQHLQSSSDKKTSCGSTWGRRCTGRTSIPPVDRVVRRTRGLTHLGQSVVLACQALKDSMCVVRVAQGFGKASRIAVTSAPEMSTRSKLLLHEANPVINTLRGVEVLSGA